MRSFGPKKTGSFIERLVLLIFALGWCGILAFIDVELGRSVWLQARSTSYIPGQATMLKSELSTVRSRKGRTHGVAMLYTYEVAGQRFTSERYAFQAMRSSDSQWARDAVAQHPVGANVTIFYDPQRPHLSVIRRGLDGSDIFTLMFLTPFHLVGLALILAVSAPLLRLVPKQIDHSRSEPGGRERIFVGEWRPFGAFLGVFGFASFIGIFLIAIPFGFHPPLWYPLTVWVAAIILALWVALSTRRKIREGECDLVLDRHAAVLSLPPMHGREAREEIRFTDIAKVEAREVYEIPNSRLKRKSRKVTEVILRTKSGAELLLKKPWSIHEAQRWAQWLQNKMTGVDLPYRP